MELSEMQDFVDWEIKRLDEFSMKKNGALESFGAAKSAEEIDKVEDEATNIIIATCVFARRNGIDIVDALERKVEAIRRRKYG